MAGEYNWKEIRPVPTAKEFVDIVLTRTQRRTPTVVHPGYDIGRIRKFYLRKVRFTSQTYHDKLTAILEDFPRLDALHPLFKTLLGVLYDADHFRLALGQLNIARSLIDQIQKDYVRLIKYGESLYHCKQLKRAALGRMCTVMRKQGKSLEYLEQVRQHLSRLPSIDPKTRTLLVCGYPNVGKSSFMNKVTRANVEVHNYAFTTQSLYVGHMDYEYLRWQVIDTPGILDRPLAQRNTIEMQSIVALAHLQCAVLYFIDVSEQCGYTIDEQLALFRSIEALFKNKPVLLICNKIDQRACPFTAEERAALPAAQAQTAVSEADAEAIRACADDMGAQLLRMSNITEDGVMDVKQRACELLLRQRVDAKVQGRRVDDVLNRLTVVGGTNPRRPPEIPPAVLEMRRRKAAAAAAKAGGGGAGSASGDVEMDEQPAAAVRTERDLMWENGGPGVYQSDRRKNFLLLDEEWRYDQIPEIMDGMNVADFVDADIDAKLAALEAEEAALEAGGHYDVPEPEALSMEEEATLAAVQQAKGIAIQESRSKHVRNHSTMPRKFRSRRAADVRDHLGAVGVDAESMVESAGARKRGRSLTPAPRDHDRRSRSRGGEAAGASADGDEPRVRGRSQSRAPAEEGMANAEQQDMAEKIKRKKQRTMNRMARAGEADRHQTVKNVKWMLAGKRPKGTTRSR